MAIQKQFVYLIRPYREGFIENMTAEEERIMDEHFEYLKSLFNENKVTLAGPCLDGAFGIIILEVDSEERAKQIMRNDPSVKAGIMKAELHPFKISLQK